MFDILQSNKYLFRSVVFIISLLYFIHCFKRHTLDKQKEF